MKKDFPETCCCMICWWIIMYCTIPVEDRHPQLGWLQSSVPTCFFKKNASSSTPLGTHGVRLKSLAITMALTLFPSFNFCSWCKARWLRFPKSIPHFQHFSVCQDIWSAQWSIYLNICCRSVAWIYLSDSTVPASKISVRWTPAKLNCSWAVSNIIGICLFSYHDIDIGLEDFLKLVKLH